MTPPERERAAQIARELSLRQRRASWTNPAIFARDVLQATPTDYQDEILQALVEYRRVAVRGPHALGKTAMAAWAVLWGVARFGDDFKVVTTASAWRQLTKFLWPEISKWFRRADWGIVGIKPELLKFSISVPGGEAFAAASDKPDLIEGAHAKKILYIFDEAKAIPDSIWDAVEGALSTGDCLVLAISTPGPRLGRFYQIHRRAAGFQDWKAIHVTIDDAIRAGRINPEWVEARRQQWGEDSPVYQAKVLGEFPEMSDKALISLAWVEAARFNELKPGNVSRAGLDVAAFGDDDSALVIRRGGVILETHTWHGNDPIETGSKAHALAEGVNLSVDEIGMGLGVTAQLKVLKHPHIGINVGEAANDPEHFANLKAELWWGMRQRFRDNEIDLTRLSNEHYDRLVGELTAMEYDYDPKGRIRIGSKEELKKLLDGKSPDLAEGLMLSFSGTPGAPSGVMERLAQSNPSKNIPGESSLSGGRWGRGDSNKAWHK